jgi:hypothetical protein
MEKEIDLLLSDYRKFAIAYGVAYENFNNSDQEEEMLMKIFSKLKQIGGDIIYEKLKPYLYDENKYVIFCAATELFDKYPIESKKVLKKLTQEDGMVELAAIGFLDLWETGYFEVEPLLSDYKKAAVAYGVAYENSNSTIANQEHEKLMKTSSQLKQIGSDIIYEYLRTDLYDENKYIILWAATELLKLNKYSIESKKALKKLIQKKGMIKKAAMSVLDLQ